MAFVILTGMVVLCFCVRITQGCPQMNISCNNVMTIRGFEFPHKCPEGSKISVSDNNKTSLAHAEPGKPLKTSDEVTSIDNNSVVTRHCNGLEIKCEFSKPDEKGKMRIKDRCVEYQITEEPTNANESPTPQGARDRTQEPPKPNDSPTPLGRIIGPIFGVTLILIIGSIVRLCVCYRHWKKKQTQQGAASSFSGFLRFLRTSCSQAVRGETQETGNPEESRVEEASSDDLVLQTNGGMRLSELASASDPHGVASDFNQGDTLRSVIVHSIDRNADGRTPQSVSLDHNLSDEGIKPTENGDCAPDDNRASNDQDMTSLRDDPGGVNTNKGEDADRITEMPNGWTVGERGLEDQRDEEEPLLPDQGAANQRSDMTGGAVAVVDKHGFNPAQVSRCSTDTDVESTMKNSIHK